MSSLSKPLLILVLMSSVVVGGCDVLGLFAADPEVYVPDDAVAELRGPHKIKVWTRDKDGNMRKAYVMAHDRWLIGPPAASIKSHEDKQAEPIEKSTFDPEANPKMLADIHSDCR